MSRYCPALSPRYHLTSTPHDGRRAFRRLTDGCRPSLLRATPATRGERRGSFAPAAPARINAPQRVPQLYCKPESPSAASLGQLRSGFRQSARQLPLSLRAASLMAPNTAYSSPSMLLYRSMCTRRMGVKRLETAGDLSPFLGAISGRRPVPHFCPHIEPAACQIHAKNRS